jgi:putative membrane protein
MTLSDIPALNATLNALVTVLLIAGRRFIKRDRKEAHRNCMVSAVVLSAIFLACYLYYHFQMQRLHGQAHTSFRDPAWFRPIYLTLLGTHLLGAVVNLPMVIATVVFAAKGQFDRHLRLACWTWPLWLYVSVTGVLIYLLLYRIFPQAVG